MQQLVWIICDPEAGPEQVEITNTGHDTVKVLAQDGRTFWWPKAEAFISRTEAQRVWKNSLAQS